MESNNFQFPIVNIMLPNLLRKTAKSMFPVTTSVESQVPHSYRIQKRLHTEKSASHFNIQNPVGLVGEPQSKDSQKILNDSWINKKYDETLSEISGIQTRLLSHSMYSHLTDMDSLKILMSSHVFQVWDFMFLVKKMQHILQNNNKMPWIPPNNNQLTRFIQEIVLCEETDSFSKLTEITGKDSMSHLEMYLLGMENVGLETNSIKYMINEIQNYQSNANSNVDYSYNLDFDTICGIIRKNRSSLVVNECLDMFEWNLKLSMESDINNLHLISAAFIFGRENIIPPMFEQVIKFIPHTKETQVFWLYLERHIEVDGGSDTHDEESHQELGSKLIKLLCNYDKNKWNQCLEIGVESLTRRYKVWDQVLEKIQENKIQNTFI